MKKTGKDAAPGTGLVESFLGLVVIAGGFLERNLDRFAWRGIGCVPDRRVLGIGSGREGGIAMAGRTHGRHRIGWNRGMDRGAWIAVRYRGLIVFRRG